MVNREPLSETHDSAEIGWTLYGDTCILPIPLRLIRIDFPEGEDQPRMAQGTL